LKSTWPGQATGKLPAQEVVGTRLRREKERHGQHKDELERERERGFAEMEIYLTARF